MCFGWTKAGKYRLVFPNCRSSERKFKTQKLILYIHLHTPHFLHIFKAYSHIQFPLDRCYIVNSTNAVSTGLANALRKTHEDRASASKTFSKENKAGNSLNVRYAKNTPYHLLLLLMDASPSQYMTLCRNHGEYLILLLKIRKFKGNEGGWLSQSLPRKPGVAGPGTEYL